MLEPFQGSTRADSLISFLVHQHPQQSLIEKVILINKVITLKVSLNLRMNKECDSHSCSISSLNLEKVWKLLEKILTS
jgi:hypothetical protein